MTAKTACGVFSMACLLAAVGCAKREAAPATETTNAASTPPAQARARSVCEMVTAADMSTILGATVAAEGENGVGTTKCLYQPAERSTPHVEISVDWGNGAVALSSFGMLSRLEPGIADIADPMAGLGDQAMAIGPALMIRTGDDLVNVTMWGVDDSIASAKRIIAVMRPRMGPSAQAKGGDGNGEADEAAAKAGKLVGRLLKGLADHKDQQKSQTDGQADNTSEGGAHRSPSAPPDEATFGPASGVPIRIPLVAGLTIIGAQHEPGRGDYEPIVTVGGITNEGVSTIFSANLPEGSRLQVDRAVRREDLRQARGVRSWYMENDPRTFDGTTSFGVSRAVLDDLRTTGQAEVILIDPDSSSLAAIVSMFAGTDNVVTRRIMLTRVEPHAVAFPVLVNDVPAQLHAIHARGTFGGVAYDFLVLDDADNPVVLRAAGDALGRVVSISFPMASATPIEEKLKNGSRVELHGIYFDVGKATIRPESEPVLREIAATLAHHPDWTINIEGHTDNIGGDAINLDLSRRRADAVKQALVDRYRIAASHFVTAGFGASRPADSNDTLSGRARNRRVELGRQ